MRFRAIWVGMLILSLSGNLAAQTPPDWNTAGNTIVGSEWFGADVGSLIPLSFETRVNRQMLWRTDNTLRMQLNPTLSGQAIGIFGGLDLSGYLGVGDFTGIYPWASAKLHLENNPTIAVGYRPAMGDGLLSTQGEALFYSGLLATGGSGIIWSWATGPSGAPRPFRFVYTGDNQTTTTAGGVDGLELARLEPASSLNEGYFGIGDWTTAGATPDERLDVLDRTIRVRRLIPDYQDMSNTMNSVVVADANGRLHWRDITSLAPCTWGLSAINDVHTAWDGFACEPQGINNVGIGTEEPLAKLHVADLVNNGFSPTETAVWGQALSLADRNVGVFGEAWAGTESTGLLANAANAERNWGTYSVAIGGGSTVGVYGHADGSMSGNPNPIGVWGHTLSPAGAGWGGWFDGRGYLENGPWVPSDEQFKTDVQVLQDPLTIIDQLSPVTFYMDTVNHPFFEPSDGVEYGFLAQDLEPVVPSMVRNATRPAVWDSLGQVLEPERTFKVVKYDVLIPILVAAVQEQRSQIQQLQQDLATCCTLDDTGLDLRSGEYDGFTNATSLENDRLTIAPNPFQERTTLSYLLDAPARVRLQVHTESGMHLATLRDQPQESGSYSMTWDTQDLAPGLYYVTLFADGKPVVKKAVKVR